MMDKFNQFIRNIYESDKQKISDIENKFVCRYAYLPTKLNNGKWIWRENYLVRYRAAQIKHIEYSSHGQIRVTNVLKHYIDKDFCIDYTKPIEKISMNEFIERKYSIS